MKTSILFFVGAGVKSRPEEVSASQRSLLRLLRPKQNLNAHIGNPARLAVLPRNRLDGAASQKEQAQMPGAVQRLPAAHIQRQCALLGGCADAVRILEGCQAEGVATEEIGSLLEFARREEEKHRSEALMRSRAAQAQALIDASAYDEAIAFLEGAPGTSTLCNDTSSEHGAETSSLSNGRGQGNHVAPAAFIHRGLPSWIVSGLPR